MLVDSGTAEDIHGDEITLKHLMGEAGWETLVKQASDIPRPVLEKVTRLSEKAFLEMQPSSPLQYYLGIFQGPMSTTFSSLKGYLQRWSSRWTMRLPGGKW